MGMKHIVITLALMLTTCDIASAQWTKVYQSDSCHCNHLHDSPLAGMEFFGQDSGVVCTALDGITSVTFDGSVNWKGSPLQFSVSPINSSTSGRNYCFLDVNHIWFCDGSTLCHTSDAGQTWIFDTNKTSLGYSVQCIYFLDSLNGFEGGQGYSLFRTSDGGKNWNLIYDSSSVDGSVYQIKFCTPKLGLAVCGAYLSYVLRTTDGGINWTNDTVGGDFSPTGLSYPDPHNAWYTDRFWLYHSTDSGLTWTTGSIDNPLGYGGFRSSCFLDSIHGIATGGDPDTLKFGYTSDGGKSWQTTTIDSEGSYETFTSFPDSNTAYVGGYDAVYKLNIGDLGVQATSLIDSNVRIYPNPFSQSTQITFTSQAAGYTEVSIVNMLGVEVARLFSGELGAGEHNFSWDATQAGSPAPRGTYEFVVRMNGQVETVPLVKF
jgi:photosystem II stability/assembly factor-like uncharacterized protein